MGSKLQRIPEGALDTLATNSLVKSTCQFLQKCDLSLHHDIKIKPLREQDQLIMEALSALGPITSELKKNQMIILSVCHTGVATHQVHRTTSSQKGLGFLNVI